MYCSSCGGPLAPGTLSCGQCGQPASTPPPAVATCAVHPGVPAEAACTRCGTFACAACLEDGGAERLCTACRGREGTLPWDQRGQLGLWLAFWRTCVLMIRSPQQALEAARPDGTLGSSMLFSLLAGLAGYGTSLLLCGGLAALGALGALGAMAKGHEASVPEAGLVVLGVVVYAVLLVCWQVAGLFLVSAMDHVGLFLVGGQPRAFSVTVRAAALSQGVYLVGLVPVCGFYVFPLWSLGLRVAAVARFHRTTTGKALAAVLLPTFGFCCLFTALYMALIGLAGFLGH